MSPNGSIVLFEDQFVNDMRPIALTRPAFAVTCAVYNLFDVARMACERVDYVVREYMAKVVERDYPPSELGNGPLLMLNAGAVPDVRMVPILRKVLADGEPFLAATEQRAVAALLPAGTVLPEGMTSEGVMPWLLGLDLPVRDDLQLRALTYPFHVVGALPDVFEANLRAKIAEGGFDEVRPGLFVRDGVKIADNAVFHTDEGPVVLDEGVRILDFAYLVGPVYMGPGSRMIERSSVKEHVSIGHTCKIGGEVECSTIEPYTNKQHHGFLGHSYVGSWVNMGAGTSNSDLKNTYGEVRVEHGGQRLATGMQFFGCVMGDYSKTAINTSIFTGKIIGVSSMMYGFVGQNVPSFCNYAKSFGQVTECTLEQAIITQQRMFGRRKVEQGEEDIQLLRDVYDLTREDRQLAAELPVL